MKTPSGFSISKPGTVCRLPQCRFAKLASSSLSYGFVQFHSDYSLFTYNHGGAYLFVLVCVDHSANIW